MLYSGSEWISIETKLVRTTDAFRLNRKIEPKLYEMGQIMEINMKVHEGTFHLVGVPIIITTSYYTETRDLFSEYFAFFRCHQTFFDWKRMHHVYNPRTQSSINPRAINPLQNALNNAKLGFR